MARQHYETLQEVFDDAYRGLFAQGFEQSTTNSGDCAYRGDKGLRCAIGYCIPDEEYDPSIEGFAPDVFVSERCESSVAKKVFGTLFAGMATDQLVDLQRTHDFAKNPAHMADRLASFAAKHGLTIPSIEGAA